ncbi:MAG TPA: DsbE family thiol:disulfide interchange protein [Hyphomicrobiales bacterium]|nr:DsbE family thiol:disulfide interchange protein [Hyphomicrobiales bacterium]
MSDQAARPARRRVFLFLPALAFIALAALLYVRLGAGDPSTIPSALIGRPAPAFSLPALSGLEGRGGGMVPGLATADLTDGKPSVVNVFASWCAPCREEHPVLLKLGATPGVRLLGIDYKDDAGNARRFLNALGNPYDRVGVDASGRSAIDWGVYGVPETFVLDGQGRIVLKHVGPLTDQAVANDILPALKRLGGQAARG